MQSCDIDNWSNYRKYEVLFAVMKQVQELVVLLIIKKENKQSQEGEKMNKATTQNIVKMLILGRHILE